MSKQVQMPGVGMIALGVFIVAFVLLMVIGYSFLAALFFALVVTAAVAIFFLIAKDQYEGKGEEGPAAGRSAGGTTAAPLAASTPPVSEPARPPDPSPTPEPQPTPAAPPTGDQTEPKRLDAPREGGADDLKRIKGIGPKIEQALNGMGFYHIDQIASWGPAEIAWMDEHLVDFRGRVTRDDWVGQARQLAGGDETAFSRRVDEGDVHD